MWKKLFRAVTTESDLTGLELKCRNADLWLTVAWRRLLNILTGHMVLYKIMSKEVQKV